MTLMNTQPIQFNTHAASIEKYFDLKIIIIQLEPGAMLFPAAFVTPTAQEVLQFELGRIKVLFSHYLVLRE